MTKARSLIYLAVYLAVLFLLRGAVASAFPDLPIDGDNLWFASGLLLVVLGVFVTEKHFTKPLDVVVSAITLVVVLHTVTASARFVLYGPVYFYTITVGVMALAAFALSREDGDPASTSQRVGSSLYRVSSFLGSARLLFSLMFVLSLFNYFIVPMETARVIGHQEVVVLMMIVFWAVTLLIEPIDRRVIAPLTAMFVNRPTGRRIGRVIRRINPNIVVVQKVVGLVTPAFGDTVLITTDGRSATNGLVAIYFDDLETEDGRYLQFYIVGGQVSDVSPDHLVMTLTAERAAELLGMALEDNDLYQRRNNIVGVISAHSDIDVIKIKMLNGVDRRMELAEGDLLSVELYGRQVKYQIIGVSTDMENVDAQNKKGAKYISAQQVGEWNDSAQKFFGASWVPDVNTLVFQEADAAGDVPSLGPNFYRVGLVPKSKYPVYINFEETVSHHLAIIGKTGTGKSQMAARIVESLARAGYKVVVLEVDQTHHQCLSRRIDPSLVSAEGTRWTSTQEPRTRGGRTTQETVWSCQMNLNAADGRNVFVVSLDNQAVDMDGGPLSHSESASAVIKEVLIHKRRAGNENQKICIVLEEAYDFIPESTFGQQDFGQPNVSRIAQLALKCRKHNVGFVVITQRTALVSKTILYQCNTIIALQTFDETSKTFMSAYINSKYLESMSILPRFRAIVVGKGSSCDKPVIVDFEDRPVSIIAAAGVEDDVALAGPTELGQIENHQS